MVKSSSWCEEQVGLKKGPWTPEEDQKLTSYIQLHGQGSWSSLPAKAGLRRCGKSCRLRWINYLRPDIKRGSFSSQEDQTIIQLHGLLGNKWSVIASHLPKRTDNEIKNHWNTHLKKRLIRMGINPTTHKPFNDVANFSHMAQWETARLEAEARQAREYSKLRLQNQLSSSSSQPSLTRLLLDKITPPCLEVLRAWQNSWPSQSANHNTPKMYNTYAMMLTTDDLESSASTLNFPSYAATTTQTVGKDNNGIKKGPRDRSEPSGDKEQSEGEHGNIMAAGQYDGGNEMSPGVGDDWEDILDLVNGWPLSPTFPMV